MHSRLASAVICVILVCDCKSNSVTGIQNPMPKPFTEQEKTIIGRRLLEQGYKHFSTYGLAKTNVEEIARAAGISKGAFYKFYGSKEELFWSVIEQAEAHVREQILAVIDRPGRSPRARLVAILREAFALFEAFPILKLLTGGDYELLFRGIPPEKLGGHLANDRAFIERLISRCRGAGIPIRSRCRHPDEYALSAGDRGLAS